MTAQIGILNKKAIVLATDSAVTISSGENEKKIYSGNKLFSLSKLKPLAIMIYGNAELLGTPWETIIKVYRKQTQSSFKTLNEYANNFIQWLKNNTKKLVPTKLQENYLRHSIFSFFLYSFVKPTKEKVKQEFEQKKIFNENESIRFVKFKINETFLKLKKKDYISGYNEKFHKAFIQKYSKIIKQIIVSFFPKFKLSKSEVSKLIDIAGYIFLKDIFEQSGVSGIVIAGFGDEDLYPSLVQFEIEGVFDNKLKYKQEHITNIKSDGCIASISPFAQGDMIESFMSGIHPANRKFFKRILEIYPSLISKDIASLSQVARNRIKKKIDIKNKEIYSEFVKSLRKNFSDRIIQMVSRMPITEMCELAESLVNLTALKKKVTMQAETVGGDTEVVSITKGEGLIWIKRKHYFEPKLNPGFINNYMNI